MPALSRPGWYLLLAGVFATHNAEEAVAAPRTLELMRTHAPGALRSLYVDMSVGQLRTNLAVLSVLALALAIVAARRPCGRGWSYGMLLLATVMGLNALAHVAFALTWRAYMPGLVTALGLTLPCALIALRRGWREAWVARNHFWTLLPVALLVHGPLLAAFIRAGAAG
jgi:hypothetical protein